jgi:hypothetical protein
MNSSNTDKSIPNSDKGHRTISNKAKDIIKAFSWWLYLKWLRAYSKSILKAHADNRIILVKILSDEFLSTYGNKDSEFRLRLAFSVTDRFLRTEPINPTDFPEALREELKANEEFDIENEVFINYEQSRFTNDTRIEVIRVNHFRVNSLKNRIFLNQPKADEYLVKAQAIKTEATPLDFKSFSRLSKELKRERKTRTKAYRNRIRQQAVEKQNPAFSLGLSFHDVTAMFGVASILFLCGGYIYNRLLLGYFGVDVSKFFQINDYLSASIDKISITGITVIANFVLAFLYWSPSYLAARKKMSKKRLLFEDFPFYITLLSIPLALVSSIYLDLPQKYFILLLFLVIIASEKMYILTKYFKNEILGYIILTYVFLFFGLIFMHAFVDRERIAKNVEPLTTMYHISQSTEAEMPKEELSLITSSSSYYFFFSRKSGKTYVVQKQNVSLVEISNVPRNSLIERIYNLMHPETN